MEVFLNSVASFWKPDLEEYPLGWDLKKLSQPPSSKFWTCVEMNEHFSLYRRSEGSNPCFMIAIHNRRPECSDSATKDSKAVNGATAEVPSLVIFSVARFATPSDAHSIYNAMQQCLTILLQNAQYFFKEGNMKMLMEAFSRNTTFGPAHLLVQMGLTSFLKSDWIKDFLVIPEENGVYPIHVACKVPRIFSFSASSMLVCNFNSCFRRHEWTA